MTRVLVTDAHSTAALAVVRSLGAAGFDVTVAGEQDRINFAAVSRYCRRFLRCPSSSRQPLEYADTLAAELRMSRYDLLVPTNDSTVTIVWRQRARFDELTRVALPPSEILEHALDKRLTVEAAGRVGVRVPRTWALHSIEELNGILDQVSYPCVIKPRVSRYWDGVGTLRSGTVRYANSADALRTAFTDLYRLGPLPLVQELVEGRGVGVFILADRGKVRVVFSHRRVREANPTGGAASLSESIAPDQRLVAPAIRLVESLGWHGVAMAEFKDPGAPGSPALMEINGRLWGSLPLSIACGIDFPLLMANLFLRRELAIPDGYRIGVRCRHLKADASHVAAVLKGRPDRWQGPFPGRLETILAVLPAPGRWRSYNFRLSDPVPGLMEGWGILTDQVRAIISASRSRAPGPAVRESR
jgi:predicted ATP-grasp superfamily ATP-dependent carboligase